jgi:hypothetical protein
MSFINTGGFIKTSGANDLIDNLQEALNKSNNIEAIIILDLIKDAAQLYNHIREFNVAYDKDKYDY